MAFHLSRNLSGLLLLLSLFVAAASAFNGVGPVERVAPPPGLLRCSLRVDLKDNGVISSSLGGDLGGHGDLNIYVYKYQGGLDVHISYNTHELSLPMPPLNQSINLGRRGVNGAVVWNIAGTWTQRNEDQLELKRVFKRAPSVTIPGTGISVYKMVKMIDRNPGKGLPGPNRTAQGTGEGGEREGGGGVFTGHWNGGREGVGGTEGKRARGDRAL
ncbi:unnamed protein product [Closterium sp. NIES-64]|nr:unnamed protein product [Closterium sp. NIES-64]